MIDDMMDEDNENDSNEVDEFASFLTRHDKVEDNTNNDNDRNAINVVVCQNITKPANTKFVGMFGKIFFCKNSDFKHWNGFC